MTRIVRRLAALAVAIAALGGLSGCALTRLAPAVHPDTGGAGASRGARTATVDSPPAVHDNEVATPPGPPQRAPVAASPTAALRRFATIYVNWDAADVRARMLALAADSVGQARGALALTAQQTGADPELGQAQIANRGTVEAVSELAGAGHRYVVVTLESTSAAASSAYAGIAPAWHVTLAAVSPRPGGWVISGWQPENSGVERRRVIPAPTGSGVCGARSLRGLSDPPVGPFAPLDSTGAGE